MTRNLTQTRELFEKAKQFIPYGVNSNFRYWGEEDTLVVMRGEGSHVWDVDENQYIDYRLAFGPIILGHGYPPVVERVAEAIRDGTLFAWTTPLEIQVAERIVRLTGVEKVRLSNTGTEATMHALRIARAYTGRERFIKFEGQYHGMYDYVLFTTASTPASALGSRRNPINVQMSSGIPEGIRRYVINLPFNDFERLEEAVEAHWHELAAIMVEPILGNAAGIMSQPGWLEKVRELCDRHGIVLIFDEVKTGFRVARGGAQEYFGVKADLVTYAKAMGNGFPIAAIGGKEEVMMVIEPGRVSHGGTYTGNTVGTAAAAATLEILETEPVYEALFQRGQMLMDGIHEILNRAGIPHFVTGLPPMFSFILGVEEEPVDFRGYCTGDDPLYERLAMALLERGVMLDCDGREPWFLSYSHSEQDIADTLTAFEEAVKAVI
ncbi:MAG: aminotransferase class III-fold pyridoxal phosphate-dependent enzyme [Anaerolineae bacterium]|nr:aminotransferase class III-fold pyridoxal phosphate-dependent enzyme [Anaerolineae bacterium]